VLVLDALQTVGKQLRDAQKAFDLVDNRLVAGRGNLVDRIARLKELGAKTRRQLPPDLVSRASEEEARAANLGAPAPSKLTLVTPPAVDE
jgi:DNA recombination protein RmuC